MKPVWTAFFLPDAVLAVPFSPQARLSPAAVASLALANQGSEASASSMPGMKMDGMASESISNMVSFPYGFPLPGRCRIFIQMQNGETVEAGVFDATVKAASEPSPK